MTMPAAAQPLGEPFSEVLSEAAQAAAMSVRLILTIADAVRRAAQKHHQGKEKELGADAEELAEGWSAEQLRTVLPESALHGLMAGADWPLMARHLTSLQQAGVDLGVFLPNLGRMASAVEQAVARNTTRTRAEGTDRWADLLRATMPEGLVRNAILASRAWPDLAAEMGHLHDQGVDVARILTDAHAARQRQDQAVAAASARASARAQAPSPTAPTPAPAAAVRTAPATATATAPAPAPAAAVRSEPVVRSEPAPAPAPVPDPWAARPVPPVSTDAKRAWGPLNEGLTIPRDLDLADRAHALDQLGISTGAHRLLVSRVNEALPERDAALLVNSRLWPLLAHRMHTMAQAGEPFTAHLAPPRPRHRRLAHRPARRPGHAPAPRRSLRPHHTAGRAPAHRPPRLRLGGPLPLHHRPGHCCGLGRAARSRRADRSRASPADRSRTAAGARTVEPRPGVGPRQRREPAGAVRPCRGRRRWCGFRGGAVTTGSSPSRRAAEPPSRRAAEGQG
ncbi:hypothetical protein LCE32_36090, partial [Streptomyces sp. 7G]|uniref:hypothetical protein n=1 Tax=Streptomyces sp. 7G TaxID=2877241 RepID=UPI001CD66D8A